MLSPGAIQWDALGYGSDARQMLSGALASIRPAWGSDLLLARYAADDKARKSVEYVLMAQMADMVWPEKHPPNTWRPLVRMAILEHIDPPECAACKRTTKSWMMADGALQSLPCPVCNGRGTRNRDEEELAEAAGVDWAIWGPRYRALRRTLRVTERAALSAMSDALSEL